MSGVTEQLIEALNRHSAALETFNKNTAKGGTAGGASGGSTGGGASTGNKANNKPKGPTLEDIQAKFGEYMSIQDKTERNRRKEIVLKIAGKFDADRATNIAPKHFEEALELLEAYKNGEDPLADGDGEDDGGSPI